MKVNRFNNLGGNISSYKNVQRVHQSKRRKALNTDAQITSPTDYIQPDFNGLSFRGTMKEIWKHIKKGASFLSKKFKNKFKRFKK